MRDVIGSWGQLLVWVVAVLAIAVAAGIGAGVAGLGPASMLLAVIVLPLLLYAGLGLAGASGLLGDMFVAGRAVPAGWNGLAAGAQWATGTVFLGYVGFLFLEGHDAFALALGWSAGFVLLGVLVAPYINKSGALTLPDLFARRYGGGVARVLAALVVVGGSVLLLAAALAATSLVLVRVLAPHLPWLSYQIGVAVALLTVFLVLVPGGMRSLSLAQAAQGAVLLIGFLLPAVAVAYLVTGTPVPQLAAVDFAEALRGLEQGGAVPSHFEAFAPTASGDPVDSGWDFTALALSVAIATAALPPLVSRFATTASVRDARRSAVWALFFVVILVITAPAFAVLARFAILDGFAAGGGAIPFDAMPAWLVEWGRAPGFTVTVCGAPPVDAATVAAACGEGAGGGFGFADLAIAPDTLLLMLPDVVGLPPVVGALLVAGALAAILSSAGGFGLTAAASLANDLFAGSTRDSEPGQRVWAFRFFVLLVAAAAGWLASVPWIMPAGLVGWALGVTGAALLPPLVLAVWDERSTAAGASAAIVTGAGLALLHILLAEFGPDFARLSGDEVRWLGLGAGAAAVIATPVALVVGLLVSRLTPAPDPARLDFIEEMRLPAKVSRPAEF